LDIRPRLQRQVQGPAGPQAGRLTPNLQGQLLAWKPCRVLSPFAWNYRDIANKGSLKVERLSGD